MVPEVLLLVPPLPIIALERMNLLLDALVEPLVPLVPLVADEPLSLARWTQPVTVICLSV